MSEQKKPLKSKHGVTKHKHSIQNTVQSHYAARRRKAMHRSSEKSVVTVTGPDFVETVAIQHGIRKKGNH